MKTLLLLALCALSTAAVSGQNQEYVMYYFYRVPFIMPDASFQNIYLAATHEGKNEFLRVASENIMQIEKVSLRQKVLNGATLDLSNAPSISERTAYRFLANKLCESCESGTLSKSNTTVMVVNTPTGRKNLLVVFWIPEKGWTIQMMLWSDTRGGKITLEPEHTTVLVY